MLSRVTTHIQAIKPSVHNAQPSQWTNPPSKNNKVTTHQEALRISPFESSSVTCQYVWIPAPYVAMAPTSPQRKIPHHMQHKHVQTPTYRFKLHVDNLECGLPLKLKINTVLSLRVPTLPAPIRKQVSHLACQIIRERWLGEIIPNDLYNGIRKTSSVLKMVLK